MTTKTTANGFLRAAALAGLGLALAGGALAQDVVLPDGAVPLTAPELLTLYGGKTWQWGTGGGYFDTEGRVFRARTVGEQGEATATGRWRITDSGRLCFAADWVTATGTYPANSCFEHMQSGADIYQRKLPDGQWYVFKHASPEPEDEFSKLVRKDLVSGASEASGGNEGGV